MRGFLIIFLTVTVNIAFVFPKHGKSSNIVPYSTATDGDIIYINLDAKPDYRLLDEIGKSGGDSTYWLYTSYLSPLTACLNKTNSNVILVDWSFLSLKNYITACAGVPAVGRSLGQFLDTLSKITGQYFSLMHLVGFSLGAHVVGNAGRKLGGQIARITGLDPAGPLWYFNSNSLRASDAEYVEAIHTDALILGMFKNVGHVDFYPNGGVTQPGCITDSCNQSRATELFAATVTYDRSIGKHCSSRIQLALNLCHGSRAHMGNDRLKKDKIRAGMYRLDTNATYPYNY